MCAAEEVQMLTDAEKQADVLEAELGRLDPRAIEARCAPAPQGARCTVQGLVHGAPCAVSLRPTCMRRYALYKMLAAHGKAQAAQAALTAAVAALEEAETARVADALPVRSLPWTRLA
jgi:hypothetical protein